MSLPATYSRHEHLHRPVPNAIGAARKRTIWIAHRAQRPSRKIYRASSRSERRVPHHAIEVKTTFCPPVGTVVVAEREMDVAETALLDSEPSGLLAGAEGELADDVRVRDAVVYLAKPTRLTALDAHGMAVLRSHDRLTHNINADAEHVPIDHDRAVGLIFDRRRRPPPNGTHHPTAPYRRDLKGGRPRSRR